MWPCFIWTECAVIGRSHGELGCAMCGVPVCRGCDQSQRTQFRQIRSLKIRWDASAVSVIAFSTKSVMSFARNDVMNKVGNRTVCDKRSEQTAGTLQRRHRALHRYWWRQANLCVHNIQWRHHHCETKSMTNWRLYREFRHICNSQFTPPDTSQLERVELSRHGQCEVAISVADDRHGSTSCIGLHGCITMALQTAGVVEDLTHRPTHTHQLLISSHLLSLWKEQAMLRRSKNHTDTHTHTIS